MKAEQCSIQTIMAHVMIQVTAKHCFFAVIVLAQHHFFFTVNFTMLLKNGKKDVKLLCEIEKTQKMRKRKTFTHCQNSVFKVLCNKILAETKTLEIILHNFKNFQ